MAKAGGLAEMILPDLSMVSAEPAERLQESVVVLDDVLSDSPISSGGRHSLVRVRTVHRRTVSKPKSSFGDVESSSLRIVYLLAVSALTCTHRVDDIVLRHLAEAVIESYVSANRPRLPLSSQEAEDMAVMSIELLAGSHSDLLHTIH